MAVAMVWLVLQAEAFDYRLPGIPALRFRCRSKYYSAIECLSQAIEYCEKNMNLTDNNSFVLIDFSHFIHSRIDDHICAWAQYTNVI